MRLKVTLVFALLIASFCVVPVLAKTSRLLPFKAHATGLAGPPPLGSPPWYMVVSGSGTASYMTAPVTIYQHHWVIPTSDPTVLIFYNGVFVWTDYDGNVLKGTYTGYLKMNTATGNFDIHGIFFINGGTGKFQHALGGGVASGTQSPINGAADLWLDGTIIFG